MLTTQKFFIIFWYKLFGFLASYIMGDAYIIICLDTTYNEGDNGITKESAEVTELAWIIIDSKSLEEVL